MSQDKERGQARRLALLARAIGPWRRGRIILNSPHGLSSQNKDLLRLEKDGFVTLVREKLSPFHPARYGYAVLTVAGKKLLEKPAGPSRVDDHSRTAAGRLKMRKERLEARDGS